MTKAAYLIALGSNQRHHRYGRPAKVLLSAVQRLEEQFSVQSVSSISLSRPIGPSDRSYANAAVIIESDLQPEEVLTQLKAMERQFGQRRGQRWSKRVLDLDILLWDKGVFYSNRPRLCIPHLAMRQRLFVLRPAAEIAPRWHDPVSNLTIWQLLRRLKRAKPLDPKQKRY